MADPQPQTTSIGSFYPIVIWWTLGRPAPLLLPITVTTSHAEAE